MCLSPPLFTHPAAPQLRRTITASINNTTENSVGLANPAAYGNLTVRNMLNDINNVS